MFKMYFTLPQKVQEGARSDWLTPILEDSHRASLESLKTLLCQPHKTFLLTSHLSWRSLICRRRLLFLSRRRKNGRGHPDTKNTEFLKLAKVIMFVPRIFVYWLKSKWQFTSMALPPISYLCIAWIAACDWSMLINFKMANPRDLPDIFFITRQKYGLKMLKATSNSSSVTCHGRLPT